MQGRGGAVVRERLAYEEGILLIPLRMRRARVPLQHECWHAAQFCCALYVAAKGNRAALRQLDVGAMATYAVDDRAVPRQVVQLEAAALF